MKNKACVVLVIDRPGIDQYETKYVERLNSVGIDCTFLALPSKQNVCDQLAKCGGIVICGGDTENYIAEIVHTPIGKGIQEQFIKGVPVAGFSAGAIIAMEKSYLSAKDTREQRPVVLEGLGLQAHTKIAVHFSEWQEEEHLRLLAKESNDDHYGIDEQSGMYMKNGRTESVDGKWVYVLNDDKFYKL
ncbi:Type 1 glutamine amidotransferase-like domain-containing protein [Shouchella sp. 1P09AA]|uniref:Type 1 glutamine amidotransferase-like domain-containing protein n=1 Tax=unclassified Shouchella TaxID=2893065 RepID=UPI0039A0C4A3